MFLFPIFPKVTPAADVTLLHFLNGNWFLDLPTVCCRNFPSSFHAVPGAQSTFGQVAGKFCDVFVISGESLNNVCVLDALCNNSCGPDFKLTMSFSKSSVIEGLFSLLTFPVNPHEISVFSLMALLIVANFSCQHQTVCTEHCNKQRSKCFHQEASNMVILPHSQMHWNELSIV